MRINFHGKLVDEPEIRAGFIGCGSHSFRNIYPVLQFAPVNLVAVCDLDEERARAFAAKFGAGRSYTDYRKMLDTEKLDAVFVVTGFDRNGKPSYPPIVADCLRAGVHVWMEKPPADTCAGVELMQEAAGASGKHAMVGFKKMFGQANEKAKELAAAAEFGRISLVTIQYPMGIPTPQEFQRYARNTPDGRPVLGFLDHLCHPISLMVFLLGMPDEFIYERGATGAGVATFSFASGVIAAVAFSHHGALNGGMERTMIVSESGKHITVDNNIRLSYHRDPKRGYGETPSFFTGAPGEASATWEPEFSLAALYNQGLFLQGFYGEVSEFARSILEGRPPARGTLEQAWQVTRIFEAFAEGPRRVISLRAGAPGA